MEQIRNYVEALFSALPKTEALLQIKQDMLANLEDKYAALLAEGKNENEAVGAVIATIGSADELRAELGVTEPPAEVTPSAPADAPVHDPALAAEYKAFKRKIGIGIAVAVALFILSPVTFIFGENMLSEGVGMFLFFLLIAIGTGLCIVFGTREEYYQEMLGLGKKAKTPDGKPVGRNRLTSLFAALIFPLAAVIYLCLGFFAGLWHPGWIIFVFGGVLTGGIAAIEEYRRGE